MRRLCKAMAAILTAACLVLPAFGCASSENESGGEQEEIMTEEEYQHYGAYAYYYYPQLGREVMPIGAWCAPPTPAFANFNNPNYITDENYKVMSESGINSIYALYDTPIDYLELILQALDYADKYGMVYLVRDTRMLVAAEEPEVFELFEAYTSKPAYGGNLIIDEPGVNSFQTLANLKVNWDKEFGSGKNMYVNMLPMYASENQLLNGAAGGEETGSITYEEYVSRYLSMVKPDFFSVDYYPFNGKNHDVQQEFFKQLSIIKRRVEQVNIPFWTFAQAGFFDGAGTRKLEECELQWQVNAALSYGAKGIQYFNYWHPLEIPGNNCGFVDREGNKTYIYDYGVRLNRHIAAVDEILMKSANRGVICAGESPAPVPEEDILEEYELLKSVSGGDALVGCFDYRDKVAYYITANSLTKDAEITLTFSEDVSALCIQDAVTSEKSGKNIQLSIPKGEGVLIVID